jgi:hypothetical protein
VGHRWARILSDPEINVGLTCSFSQEKLMEMQCELLVSNFNDPKTIRLVKENIGRISDGSASHSGGALKLGFKKAFELKKQKRQPPGVLLRCSSTGCAGYSNPVSRTSVPVDGVCGSCRSHWMQCVSCGNNRIGNYASCQSCGKTFA